MTSLHCITSGNWPMFVDQWVKWVTTLDGYRGSWMLTHDPLLFMHI